MNSYPAQLGGVHELRLQDLAFFDHLPPSVYILYGIMVCKKSIVNVVCECPPMTVINPPKKKLPKLTSVYCSKNMPNFCQRSIHYRGVIKGKAGKHLPYPNFETIVIL